MDMNENETPVTDYSSYVSFDGQTVRIETSDHQAVGEYMISLEQTLDDYPEVAANEMTFGFGINPCKLDSYEVGESISEIYYYIGSGQLAVVMD